MRDVVQWSPWLFKIGPLCITPLGRLRAVDSKVDVIPDTSGLEISLFKARVVARGRDLIIKVEHLFKDVTPHTDFACLYFLH